jgi:hypothetical protein
MNDQEIWNLTVAKLSVLFMPLTKPLQLIDEIEKLLDN